MLAFTFVANVTVLVGAFVLAAHWDDAHLVNRGGALLVALSVVLVLYQLRLERIIEHAAPRIDDSAVSVSQLSRLGEFARWLRRTRAIDYVERLRSRRFWVIATNSGFALLGELLHGFGDLLFVLVLGSVKLFI